MNLSLENVQFEPSTEVFKWSFYPRSSRTCSTARGPVRPYESLRGSHKTLETVLPSSLEEIIGQASETLRATAKAEGTARKT